MATPVVQSSAAPSASSLVYAVGQAIPLAGRETLTVVRAEPWITGVVTGLTVDVRLMAQASFVPFDAAYFRLASGSGSPSSAIVDGRSPELAYGTLATPQDTTDGWITFPAASAGPWILTYAFPLGQNGLLDTVAIQIAQLSAQTPEVTPPPAPTPPAAPTPQPYPTPAPFPTSAPIGNEGYPTAVASTYYSGYGAQLFNDNVTSVAGGWTQPRGRCSGSRETAFAPWVGIENDVNLQQIGTEVVCLVGSAIPHYAVWFEMFPKASVIVPMRALPGDKFTASVTRSGNRWTLAIQNRTSGQHFATVHSRATTGTIALWIDEAPSSQPTHFGSHVLPLTQYGSVTMTGCTASIGGVRRAIGDPAWAHYRFDMVMATGLAKATTSGLTSRGTSFKSTWRHN
jgi:hypothetical protein